MAYSSLPSVETVREYVRPRYLSWPVANVILYAVVVWNLEETVVEPGQGGTVVVYIWPAYRASYHLQDVMVSAIPEFSWSLLVLNYVFGIAPLYIITNIGLNVILPARYRTWQPSLSTRAWGGVILFLILTYIPLYFAGFGGIILWMVIASTSLVTYIGPKAPGALLS